MLGPDLARAWFHAGVDQDLVGTVLGQLGIQDDDLLQWPDAPLAELGDQELLLVVDDADRLDPAAVEHLVALHARGGHLLLVGRGGLAQTEGDGDVQFVDLPGFNPGETAAFLRQQAGARAARMDDDLAATLHRASRGLPGPLLEALDEFLAREGRKSAAGRAVPVRGSLWLWLAGGAVVVLLLTVLVFQDTINGLLEPERASGSGPANRAATAASIQRDAAVSGTAPPDAADDVPAPLPDVALPELSRPPAPTIVSSPESPAPPSEPALAADPRPPVSRDNSAGMPDGALEAVMSEVLSMAEAPSAAAGPRLPTALQADPARSDDESPADGAKAMGAAERRAVVEEASGPAASRAEASVATPSDVAASAVSPAPVVQGSAALVAKDPPVATEPEHLSVSPAKAQSSPGGGPAPVEERAGAAPAKPPTAPSLTAAAEGAPGPSSPAGRAVSSQGGTDWLDSREPGRYTLQLVGARDSAAVRQFIRDHRLGQPYAIFERQLDGRPWYSLVAGDYPDRKAAVAARDRLPGRLGASGAWPRTFGSIQKSE
jgi:septal ring-binding cell division protein DamX